MSSGKVVSVIGAVIDVESQEKKCLKFTRFKIDQSNTTLEVQQQLGDEVVRTIAMGASEELLGGLVSNTNAPICPVGDATLGRIMDVLGNPIDVSL